MAPKNFCHSFKPIVDSSSRVLILGSMPGPEALRKQEYYGFNGNHFWTIVPALLKTEKPTVYEEKIELVRRHGIALWDVLESCIRPGAADSDIRQEKLNAIPSLIKKFPRIKAVFINGRLAHTLFMRAFEHMVDRPVFLLPSSSPANAAMSIQKKIAHWSKILEYLALS